MCEFDMNAFGMDNTKIHTIIAELAVMRGSKESKAQYLQRLREKVESALELLSPCTDLEDKINQTDKVTVQFISTSLYVLKLLACVSKDDSLNNLISIQQRQIIKVLLQLIFSIGIMPSLFRGVDIPLARKTVLLNLTSLEELSLAELYNMMSEVVRSLFQVLKAPNLRSLILVHLGDIMAALLQLIHIGEFKKPVKPDADSDKGTDNKPGHFVMTEEWYNKLTKDRMEFRGLYGELVEDIYKPLVIRELLILLLPAPSIKEGQSIAPPMWLTRAVSKQLTGYLTSPGGVSLIIRAMCDSSTDVNWSKVEEIAKLITIVHGNLSPDEFYSLISPQIISLLNTTGPYCIPVAKACIINIYRHNAEVCNKYIFDKLFEPLIICSQAVTENFDGILISEDSLTRCIDHINKCFAPGSKESTLPFKALIKIIKIKYILYMKAAESPYQNKLAIQDLLMRFFHSYKNIDKLTKIYNALIFNEPHEDMLEMNEELEFEFGPSGGIQVVKRSKTESPSISCNEIELQSELAGDIMLDLLSHNEEYSKSLLTDLFVVLLSSMSKWCDEPIDVPDAKPDLLNPDELIFYIVGKSEKKMVSIKLLAVLAENVQVIESIKENPQLIYRFVENLLEKKAEGLLNAEQEEEDEEEDDEESEEGEVLGEEDDGDEKDMSLEDLIVTLAILDIMTMNMKVGGEKWNIFKPLLNPVKIIKDNCKDTFVKFLANLLYERIATHGAVSGSKKFLGRSFRNDLLINLSVSESKFKTEEAPKAKAKNKKQKEVIYDMSGVDDTDFEAALEDACSPDAPTRGHGLIQITKLIKTMDPRAVSKKDYIFSILQQNLKHEDSYVYLAAINGLEALAVIHTGVVIEVLAREYLDEGKDSDLRMKVGEVMVRVTRILGDMIPRYKTILVTTFLLGAKNKDEFLRSSSLSNMGEVLKILRFGVGDILQEVFVCVQRIATTDKSALARRAAVLMANLLLRGVNESTFMVLESVIRDMYRTLIQVYKSDKDEITRLHADLALTEIDRIVRESFNKNLKLEKHIRIRGLPR